MVSIRLLSLSRTRPPALSKSSSGTTRAGAQLPGQEGIPLTIRVREIRDVAELIPEMSFPDLPKVLLKRTFKKSFLTVFSPSQRTVKKSFWKDFYFKKHLF